MRLHRTPPFTFYVCDNYDELSERTADFLLAGIREKPDLVLCTASGSTPQGTYDQLVTKIRQEELDTTRLTIVKLDEWLDMDRGSEGTCEAQLVEQLIGPLNLREDQYVSFDSEPDDPAVETGRVRNLLLNGLNLDIAVLGLGMNGHIGFNEPGDALSSYCHVTPLSRQSLEHPMVRDSSVLPSRGITLGMGDILRARQIVLLVNGSGKAAQMKQLVTGGVTTRFPASFLSLHGNVHCYCDTEAVTLLND
jgi:galactosamine-6-phosphate isomerase